MQCSCLHKLRDPAATLSNLVGNNLSRYLCRLAFPLLHLDLHPPRSVSFPGRSCPQEGRGGKVLLEASNLCLMFFGTHDDVGGRANSCGRRGRRLHLPTADSLHFRCPIPKHKQRRRTINPARMAVSPTCRNERVGNLPNADSR